jgi:chemotaxis protein methyltransferase CheR
MEEINKTTTELISRIQGIDVSKYEVTFLSKSVQKRMSETQCDTLDDYACLLQRQEEEAEQLIDSLQISYTEFFRNPLTFSVLEKIIIPTIVARNATSHRNEIRIWSAACAAGQETYSLAMLLKEFSNGHPEEINFRIFATDQSESQIKEAQLGQYPESALNSLSLKRVNRWFKRRGGNYTVRE